MKPNFWKSLHHNNNMYANYSNTKIDFELVTTIKMEKVYIISMVERNYSESAFAQYSTNVSAIMTGADFQYDAAFKKGRYKKQVWNQVIQSQHLHLTTIAINSNSISANSSN